MEICGSVGGDTSWADPNDDGPEVGKRRRHTHSGCPVPGGNLFGKNEKGIVFSCRIPIFPPKKEDTEGDRNYFSLSLSSPAGVQNGLPSGEGAEFSSRTQADLCFYGVHPQKKGLSPALLCLSCPGTAISGKNLFFTRKSVPQREWPVKQNTPSPGDTSAEPFFRPDRDSPDAHATGVPPTSAIG